MTKTSRLIWPTMANRLDTLFQEKRDILSVYCTAGYPGLQDTVEVISAIEAAGGDLVEIGIPFSDPLADGPVIQSSGQQALDNGMNLTLLFEQLQGIRDKVSIPLILMGYVNPIMQFGFEAFSQNSEKIGIDGTIIPDLPLEEYVSNYKSLFNQYGLYNIGLITPQTPDARLKFVDESSEGFVYMVSTSSTTGGSKQLSDSAPYFERIKGMNLSNPTLIGFNIHDRQSFEVACKHSRGGIIGSAFIKALGETSDIVGTVSEFIKSIK